MSFHHLTRRSVVRAITLLVVLWWPSADAMAQMFVTSGRDTLRGLPGVEVVVERVDPVLEHAGLSTSGLRDDITRRLRSKDIQVFSSHPSNPSDAKPYLYVDVVALEIPGQNLVAIAIHVQVKQIVRAVSTSSSIVDATTWESRTVVGLPSKELPSLPDVIGEHIDRFISDWRRVH